MYFLDSNGNYFETITAVGTPDGATPVPKRPSADHQWQGGAWVFVDPGPQSPPPVPAEITKVQFVRAMRAADLWDTHSAAIEAHPDWPYITVMPRNDALTLAAAAAIGATDAEMDAIWIAGAAL